MSLSQQHCGNKEHWYITLTLLLPGTVNFGIKISRLRFPVDEQKIGQLDEHVNKYISRFHITQNICFAFSKVFFF